AADRSQTCPRGLLQVVGNPLDEGVPGPVVGPARPPEHLRRQRKKQVVDERRPDQGARQVRPAFAEQDLPPLAGDYLDDRLRWDVPGRSLDRLEADGVRKPASQVRRGLWRGKYDRRHAGDVERGVVQGYVAL